MLGLMTKREHKSIMLDLECELVNKTKLTEVLQERIRRGEDYRARLERENAGLKAKNRELVHRVDALAHEVDELKKTNEEFRGSIRQKELLIGSFEARWNCRSSLSEEEASA